MRCHYGTNQRRSTVLDSVGDASSAWPRGRAKPAASRVNLPSLLFPTHLERKKSPEQTQTRSEREHAKSTRPQLPLSPPPQTRVLRKSACGRRDCASPSSCRFHPPWWSPSARSAPCVQRRVLGFSFTSLRWGCRTAKQESSTHQFCFKKGFVQERVDILR